MTLDGTTNAGIWDEDTTAAGNGKAQLDIDPTTTLSFTDEDGTSHTLTLHQLPGANDGRRFANLTGGPRVVSNEELAEGVVGPRFTGWTEGAWTVDLEERKGTPGGGLVTARDAFSAFRDSNTRIQSGGRTGNTTTLDIADTRAAAIGHSAGLATEGFASMADLRDFDAFVNNQAQSALAVIDAAIEEVSAHRGQLGAITSSNLETLSVTLSTEIENLTNAESTLRDADFAKESADFARHQVIVQAATAMLAQANQLPNNVLSLLTDR
jgi:flagellin-like hook-associated protein FlgL